MSKLTVLPFDDGGVHYVAVGRQPNNLRVWEIREPFLRETRMRWPACTRFLYDVEMGEPRTVDWDEFTKPYELVRLRPEGDLPA